MDRDDARYRAEVILKRKVRDYSELSLVGWSRFKHISYNPLPNSWRKGAIALFSWMLAACANSPKQKHTTRRGEDGFNFFDR
jgi:hypothetical protein